MPQSSISDFCQAFLAKAIYSTTKAPIAVHSRLGLRCVALISQPHLPGLDLINSALLPSTDIPTEHIYLWSSESVTSLEEIPGYQLIQRLHPSESEFDDFRVACDPSGLFIYVFNAKSREGAVWISPLLGNQPEPLITPFRALLSWIIQADHGQILHGAAFDFHGYGVLLSGPSGSGKSVITHRALVAGSEILADDAILLIGGMAYPVYTKMKLKDELPPELLQTLNSAPEMVGTKSTLNLFTLGERFLPQMAANYLLFPTVTQNSTLTKVATMTAVKKILIDSSSETLGSGAGTLKALMSTLSKSQCYEWQLVTDVEENWTQLLTIFPKSDK